jgi:hypothetical protein
MEIIEIISSILPYALKNYDIFEELNCKGHTLFESATHRHCKGDSSPPVQILDKKRSLEPLEQGNQIEIK